MELLSITLAANETKQFAKAGRYFEIIESTFPLSVGFYGANGAQSDSMTNALSGLYLEDPYSHFSISNGASTQTITLLLMETGRGGSRRQPGVVSVTNRVSSSVTHVEAGAPTALGFSVQQVLAPAANVRGVTIRSVVAVAQAGAGGSADVRVVASPSAPVSVITANSMPLAAVADAAGVLAKDKTGLQNITVPSGWGLYCVVNVAAVAAVSTAYAIVFEPL